LFLSISILFSLSPAFCVGKRPGLVEEGRGVLGSTLVGMSLRERLVGMSVTWAGTDSCRVTVGVDTGRVVERGGVVAATRCC